MWRSEDKKKNFYVARGYDLQESYTDFQWKQSKSEYSRMKSLKC